MTVDESELRSSARDLAKLCAALDAAKYARPKPPEVRTMKPAPGPQSPAPDAPISLDQEVEKRLLEWCVHFRDTITPGEALPGSKDGESRGPDLAEWVALKAFYIAEHPEAPDFMEALLQWLSRIQKVVGREMEDVRKKPEPWQSARSICTHLTNSGLTTNKDMLRKWAERGHITRKDMRDGSAGYRISDVRNYLESRDQ